VLAFVVNVNTPVAAAYETAEKEFGGVETTVGLETD
jgi:hypothetical protein